MSRRFKDNQAGKHQSTWSNTTLRAAPQSHHGRMAPDGPAGVRLLFEDKWDGNDEEYGRDEVEYEEGTSISRREVLSTTAQLYEDGHHGLRQLFQPTRSPLRPLRRVLASEVLPFRAAATGIRQHRRQHRASSVRLSVSATCHLIVVFLQLQRQGMWLRAEPRGFICHNEDFTWLESANDCRLDSSETQGSGTFLARRGEGGGGICCGRLKGECAETLTHSGYFRAPWSGAHSSVANRPPSELCQFCRTSASSGSSRNGADVERR